MIGWGLSLLSFWTKVTLLTLGALLGAVATLALAPQRYDAPVARSLPDYNTVREQRIHPYISRDSQYLATRYVRINYPRAPRRWH